MENSRKRRQRTEVMFLKMFHSVIRIAGTEPTQEAVGEILASPISVISGLCDSSRLGRMSGEYLSALGCSLSHLRAISYAYVSNLSVALVVEDDAVLDLSPYWQNSLEEFIEALPKGWTIIQLSLTGEQQTWVEAFEKWNEHKHQVMPSTSFWGTVSYLINRLGMLQVVSSYGIDRFDLRRLSCINADMSLLKSAVQNGTFYISTPPLMTFSQNDPSQIHKLQNGQKHVHDADHSAIHKRSRLYAFEWNALWWREQSAQQSGLCSR